jgi:hypothetical protein
MKSVKITEKDGRVIEVSDLSFDEVRDLLRLNGNGHSQAVTTPITVAHHQVKFTAEPEYAKFEIGLSDYARKFISVLHQNQAGISADLLAEKMGLKTTAQIGGVTGGGLSKLAKEFNIDLDDIYLKQVLRVNGQRIVMYKPGKEIEKVL